MKQVIFSLLAFLFLIGCNTHKPWSDTDKQKFTTKCRGQLSTSVADSLAKKFCDCELAKLSKKYSGFDEAEKKITVAEQNELKIVCAKEVNPEDSSWTGPAKDKFYKTVAEGVATSMSEENAKKYFNCIWDKLKLKFNSPAELDLFGTEAEGQQLGTECVKDLDLTAPVNNWTSQDDEDFVSNCVSTGKTLANPEKYCNCMLNKVKQNYPDKANAAKLSKEDFSSPYWQAVVKECLND